MDNPCVLDLSELEELKVYWTEDYNGSFVPETIMSIPKNITDMSESSKEIITIPVVRMGNGYAPVISKINHHYNYKWRCWTGRATLEQRQAVPWVNPY